MTMISFVLCDEPIDLDHRANFAKLTKKGCYGINNTSKLRGLATPDLIFSKKILIYMSISLAEATIKIKKLLQILEQRTLRSSVPRVQF